MLVGVALGTATWFSALSVGSSVVRGRSPPNATSPQPATTSHGPQRPRPDPLGWRTLRE
jgi:hypothetical protein